MLLIVAVAAMRRNTNAACSQLLQGFFILASHYHARYFVGLPAFRDDPRYGSSVAAAPQNLPLT